MNNLDLIAEFVSNNYMNIMWCGAGVAVWRSVRAFRISLNGCRRGF